MNESVNKAMAVNNTMVSNTLGPVLRRGHGLAAAPPTGVECGRPQSSGPAPLTRPGPGHGGFRLHVGTAS